MLKNKKIKKLNHNSQKGVVLIEAMIGLLIFAFAILGLMSLQSSLLKDNMDLKMRGEALYVVNQLVGELWSDPNNLSSYVVTKAPLAATEGNLPNGLKTITVNGAAVTVTIFWKRPEEANYHNLSVSTNIVPNG